MLWWANNYTSAMSKEAIRLDYFYQKIKYHKPHSLSSIAALRRLNWTTIVWDCCTHFVIYTQSGINFHVWKFGKFYNVCKKKAPEKLFLMEDPGTIWSGSASIHFNAPVVLDSNHPIWFIHDWCLVFARPVQNDNFLEKTWNISLIK